MSNEGKPESSAPPANEAGATGAATSTKKKENKAKKDVVIPPKKPKLSKAERRAKQEAQRAAKGLNIGGGGVGVGGKKSGGGNGQDGNGGGNGNGRDGDKAAKNNSTGSSQPKNSSSQDESSNAATKDKNQDKTLNFFSHLPPYKDFKTNPDFSGICLASSSGLPPSSSSNNGNQNLHPAVIALGIQYADGTIRGSNSRTIAMLQTFQTVVEDYSFPTKDSRTDYRNDLENTVLKPAFTYWTTKCCLHSVTMGNAFTFLKLAVVSLDRYMEEKEVKEILIDGMEAYIEERIKFADQAIVKYASTKIIDGDVILVYAKSELIQMLLMHVKNNSDRNFRVILVDSRPLLEAKDMLERLMDAGIECTYILLNSVSYVMKEVTKVFLGASALLRDGSVLNRVGTASIALIARNHNIPVLVCCETYKISSRVQLESITGNELGDPNELVSNTCHGENGASSSLLKDWREKDCLRLLNLLYDLTPSEFVSGIVTEMGILPPTSVAVLLREMNPQDSSSGIKATN